jgi:hypothetical protein
MLCTLNNVPVKYTKQILLIPEFPWRNQGHAEVELGQGQPMRGHQARRRLSSESRSKGKKQDHAPSLRSSHPDSPKKPTRESFCAPDGGGGGAVRAVRVRFPAEHDLSWWRRCSLLSTGRLRPRPQPQPAAGPSSTWLTEDENDTQPCISPAHTCPEKKSVLG